MPTEVTSQRHSLPRHETAAKPISIDDLIDDNLLASIGWDAAARRFDLPPYHPILGWSVCPVAGCGAASGPIPGGLCSACYQRRQRQIDPVDMAGYLRQPRPWVMAPSPPYAPILDLSDLPDLLRRQMLALICVQWGSGRPQLAVVLRRTVDWLRANAVASMDDPIFRRRDQRGSVDSFRRSGYTELQIALTRPEDEKIKDVWDLRVFGYPAKRVSFVGQGLKHGTGQRSPALSQAWLRATTKEFVYRALLPRQLSASSINGYVRAVGHLSVTLAAREDNGDDPAALSRADLANHLIRLNVMERSGRMSNGDHVRNCIALRRFLLDIVALGLTTASQPAYGLSSDFTLREDESPRPVRKLREDESAGNALPEVVVAQLLAPESLAAIAGTFPAQNRRLIQLMVDVGRRPGELVRLPWNCLEFDQVVDELGQTSRSPVLVHDMPKTGWKRRRLPIHGSTAAIIEEQQHDVRARFPETPVGRLSLWPAMTRNPHGTRPISEAYLGTTIANWMQVLPVLNGPDVDAVGQPVPFDRRKVFAYAFRHTFAQRHADAGTPIEVLKELMGHEKIDSTQAYYVVTAKRKRAAVRLMAPLQLNRNGIRTRPNADTLMSSEQARESIGALSVPFGVCVEPSNVRSHGRSCSFRYQCLGCSHFRTDPSYLPELRVYLSRRLADLEKLRAGTDEVAQWAAEAATPRDEEIDAVRNLIGACERQLEGLSSDEQAAVHDAIGQMRRARRDVDEMLPTSAVGRVHQPVPVLFPTINVRTRSEEML